MKKLTTVIVDHDPGARDHLRELCESRSELEILAECGSSEQARDLILTRRPDLAFLSIRMTPINGLQLARELPDHSAPMIVFVTAQNGYALEAFEVNAVDYVLKPVDQGRFCQTVNRILARARAYEDSQNSFIVGTASATNMAQPAAWRNQPHRLILEIGDRVHLVELADIESIEADRNYVWIYTSDAYRVRASLGEIGRLLPQDRFLRISRSVIVNARRIRTIERFAHGEYAIHLCGGAVVRTGRKFRAEIPGAILRLRGQR